MVIDIRQIENISPRPETLRTAVMKEQLPQLRLLREIVREQWFDLEEPKRAALRGLVAMADAMPRPKPWEAVRAALGILTGVVFDYAEYHRTLILYAVDLTKLLELVRTKMREEEAQAALLGPTALPDSTFEVLLKKSYAHDYASQLARVALRRHAIEADDRYFDDGDDSGEISPALLQFRERSDAQLQSV